MSDGASLRFHVRFVEETTSTNDDVKRAIDAGEAEGIVVRARRQVAGYGRQGRTWTSPEGGLYCSLLLRPQVEPAALPTLSLVVGLAVRRALTGLVRGADAERIQVKWPNDVVLCDVLCHPERSGEAAESKDPVRHQQEASRLTPHGILRLRPSASAQDDNRPAKLCGISLEAHAGGVCVGVGVNVVPLAERPDVGGKNRAAYVAELANAPVSVEAVLDAFLVAFAPLYERWQREGFASLVDEFNRHASLTGCDVQMVDLAGAVLATGTVERADAHGRLVLRAPDGAEIPVASGEAHIV